MQNGDMLVINVWLVWNFLNSKYILYNILKGKGNFPLFCYFCTANTMGRILAIDYGQKRVGLAVTDPLKIIANGLDTVHSKDVFTYLENYFKKETVEKVIIGYPVQVNNKPSQSVVYINEFIKKFIKKYPEMPLQQVDERFTSKLAFQAMIDGGLGKKKRADKALIDKVSATIILQSYLESIQK